MKKITNLMMFLAFASLFVVSCGKSGPEPVKIDALDTYTDVSTGFSIKYPKNWIKSEVPGARLVVFSSAEGRKRFNKYDTDGFPGAKIDVIAADLKDGMTIDSLMLKSKLFGADVYETADVTIDGVQGKKLVYSFPLAGGMFNGMMFFAAKDTAKATVVTIEAFDDSYESTYKDSFAEIIASIKLAKAPEPKKVDTIIQTEEAPPPSQTLDMRSGDGFIIGVPDNFKNENIGKAGNALRAWSFLGARRGDSFIKVETFDASKQKDLKKIVEENRASFANASPRQTTLGGQSAYLLEYKPGGSVKGRVWFAIKGDTMYRVTINWFVGEEKDFLPVFEKAVQSFKFQ
jgi:hypothetical protein